MRPSRRIPLLRGFVGATIATFAALVSHVGIAGAMPGMLGIAVPWTLALMVSTLLSGRRLSLIRVSLAVTVSQMLFHALFVLGSITPRAGIAPHVHGHAPMLSAGGTALVPEDAGMWAAHGLAAVLTVVALHRGERFLRALASLASDLLRWIGHVVSESVVARPAMSVRVRCVPAASCPGIRRLTAHGRRGPPPRLI